MIRDVLSGALTTIASAAHLVARYPEAQLTESERASADRTDGWVNQNAGFGTARDKSQGSYFQASCMLSDAEVTDLYNHDYLSAKIVNVPVREAFRSGFSITGLDDADKLTLINDYLKPFRLVTTGKMAATWGKLYGRSAIWARTDDGADPRLPLLPALPVKVEALEVIDKRNLIPFRYYVAGPKAGRPETFQIWVPRNGGVPILMGEVHETRLVMFGGAPTEAQEKLRRQGADLSVLQRPYGALRGAGNVWKAIEILTVDANQAVYSIKGLWRMIAGDPTQAQDSQANTGRPSGGLLNRIRFMDMMRSVSRAIVLDKEDETFERKPTTFTGLPELSERQWTAVSAAADIPLPLLTGEYPSGLQSTGEGPFRVFYAVVKSDQCEDYGPRLLELVKLLLRAPDAPKLTDTELTQLDIHWPDLWEPSAKELSEIKLAHAQEGQIRIDSQQISPERAALSIPESWGWNIDREQLAQAVADIDNAPEEDKNVSTLQLTPTDIAAVVTVNQALASVNLPPMSGPDGEATVEAYRAKAAAQGAAEGAPPEPKPAPGALPPKGLPSFARTDGADLSPKQACVVRWIHDAKEPCPFRLAA